MMGTLLLKFSQTETGMQQYVEFVECVQFLKVEMGMQRTAHQCQMKKCCNNVIVQYIENRAGVLLAVNK